MKILKEESGQVLVLTALSMVLLLGFAGFATDVGVLLHEQRMVQTAADSAAIAAATEALNENTPTSVNTEIYDAASTDAELNGFTVGASNGATSSTGTTLTVNTDSSVTLTDYQSAGYFQAIVTHSTPTIFMGAFGAIFGLGNNQGGGNFGKMNVSASAIASDQISSNGCIYVLNHDNNADPASYLSGSSLISSPNCGMTVDGNVTLKDGGTEIDAKFLAASGTITSSGTTPSETAQGVPPVGDPLADLQFTDNQPTVSLTSQTCTAPASSGMKCIYDGDQLSGAPNGNLSGTLQSNTIYYFDSNINGGTGPNITAPVSGSNVMIFLADNIPFDYASNGTINLTPLGSDGVACPVDSTTGASSPLCGVLIDAPTDGSGGNGAYTCLSGKGNGTNKNLGRNAEIYLDFGSSTGTFDGIIYAPYMQLFGQDQGATTTINVDLVVGNMCQQSSTFTINGYSQGDSPLKRVGLVY